MKRQDTPRNCFAYGTLMCADIMRKVTGNHFSHSDAKLKDYQRYALKQQVYPAIIKQTGALVCGVLYYDVPQNVWLRLDDFEGDMYARVTVKVKCSNAKIIDAETYVIRPEFQHLLGRPNWDLDEFIRTGKNQFENTYLGFDEIS